MHRLLREKHTGHRVFAIQYGFKPLHGRLSDHMKDLVRKRLEIVDKPDSVEVAGINRAIAGPSNPKCCATRLRACALLKEIAFHTWMRDDESASLRHGRQSLSVETGLRIGEDDAFRGKRIIKNRPSREGRPVLVGHETFLPLSIA